MVRIRLLVVWTLVLVFMLGGVGLGLAQKIDWGPSYPLVFPPTYMSVAMASDQATVVLVGRSPRLKHLPKNFLMDKHVPRQPAIRNAMFVRLDSNMEVVKTAPLHPSYHGVPHDIGQGFQADGKLFFFCSPYVDGRESQLLIQIYDSELKPLSGLVDVKSPDLEGFLLSYGARWKLAVSKDSTSILLHAFSPIPARDTSMGVIHVFHGDMQPHWKRAVQIPPGMAVQDCLVDEDGNVIVLGVQYQHGKALRRKGKPNYQFQVLRFLPEDSVQVYPFAYGDTLLTAMKLSLGQAGKIVCGGFYSLGGATSVEGTYFARIDPIAGKIEAEGLSPLRKDLWVGKTVGSDAAKAAKLKDLRLDHAVARADGGMILIAEQLFISWVNISGNSGSSGFSSPHHCLDLLVFNIAPDGRIEWVNTIKKRQISNDFGRFTSYSLYVGASELDLVYNEHRRNLEPFPKKRVVNFSLGYVNGVIALASLTPDGNLNREILAANRDFRSNCEPRLSFQVSPYRMLLFGIGVNSMKFGELRF